MKKKGIKAWLASLHPVLKELPFVLETPNDDAGWTKEIALLRDFAKEGAQ